MAKTQEELNTIKKEVETLNMKLNELTDEELEQVTGGMRIIGDLEKKRAVYYARDMRTTVVDCMAVDPKP